MAKSTDSPGHGFVLESAVRWEMERAATRGRLAPASEPAAEPDDWVAAVFGGTEQAPPEMIEKALMAIAAAAPAELEPRSPKPKQKDKKRKKRRRK